MELSYKIKEIPLDGTPLQVKQAVSRALLATVLEGTDANLETANIELSLQLFREHDNVIARGRLHGSFELPCSRCVEPAVTPVNLRFDAIFTREGSDGIPVEDETEDSPDVYMHDGKDVSLEQPVREMLIAELPIAPLCKQACLGLCAVCGEDRNVSPCAHEQVDPLAEKQSGLATALAGIKLRS